MLGRQRLPDPQREQSVVEQPLPEPRRPEPAVLVVESRDTSPGGELQPVAHGLDELGVRGPEIQVAESPGRFLAEDARQLAAFVDLDDAAVGLQVAVRLRQSGRVQPQRVVIPGHERRRRVSRDGVERFASRLHRWRPVTAPPAPAPQPAAGLDGPDRVAHPGHGFLQGRRAFEPHFTLSGGPRREMHVRVVEARHDTTPAEVDPLRAGQCRLVRADASRDALARDRQRPRGRHGRVERVDDAVVQDHSRDCRFPAPWVRRRTRPSGC